MAKTETASLIVSLTDRLSGPAKAIAGTLTRLYAAQGRNNQALDAMRGRMFEAAGAGFALARSLSAPINSAIEFESKMADIAKVVDFESPAAFKAMGKDIRELSLRIPIAASGLADIVAAAGQSNIANKDLLRFTELAAKVATAWDVTAGEAGDGLAKLKTALGLTVDQTSSLADAINHLSNKTASSAPDLFNYTKRVAPMASAFGFTATQAAALGAGMVSAGFDADVAATSFLNAGYALTAGENATKGQRAAFTDLGLSSKKVARDMQKNAVGTLNDVLNRIRKLPKEAQAATMVSLFGKEARALSPLLTNAKLLSEVMALVGDETLYAGSAQAEFSARSKTSANNIQLFRNRVTDLAISVGDALLPALNKVLDKLGPMVTSIKDLADRYPHLTAAITGATAAIVAFRIAVTALRFAGLFAVGSMLSAAISLTGLAGILTTVGAALATISAPVWLGIGLAVGLVAAAGAWLYSKWDRVTAVLKGVAAAIGDQLQPVLTAIQPALDAMAPALDAIGRAASWVGDKLSGLAGYFDGIFGKEIITYQHGEAISNNARQMTNKIIEAFKAGHVMLFNAGSEMIQSLWDGMVAKFDAFIGWVKTIPAQIRSSIGNINLSGIVSGLNPFGSSEPAKIDGARATGGPVRAGGTYLVGERGPELFSPGNSGVISPNSAINGRGGNVVPNVNVHVTMNNRFDSAGNPNTVAEMARQLGDRTRATLEASWRGFD